MSVLLSNGLALVSVVAGVALIGFGFVLIGSVVFGGSVPIGVEGWMLIGLLVLGIAAIAGGGTVAWCGISLFRGREGARLILMIAWTTAAVVATAYSIYRFADRYDVAFRDSTIGLILNVLMLVAPPVVIALLLRLSKP